MGYYVETVNDDFRLKKENFSEAYKVMCALNSNDDIKRGWSNRYAVRPEDSKSVAPTMSAWFSWMDWNYDVTCTTAPEIIEALGFNITYNDDGDIVHLSYDTKIGQEDLFFSSIAPYVENGSFISWKGEDGDRWGWKFINGELIIVDL